MMRTPRLTATTRALCRHPRFMCSRRSFICLTAAAALSSTLPSTTTAFCPAPASRVVRHGPFGLQHPQQFRLYGSSNQEDGGFLSKVKSFLPKSWFRSKEEKEAALAKKRVEQEVSGGLREILRDAPLPLRMLGGAIAPLVSGMAGALAETVGEQQRQLEELLDDARSYMVRDDAAASALGEPIVVQAPFSQSSSSTSINGQTTTRIQASFPVQGSRQSGIATMTASETGITQLVVQVGGRNVNVNLSNKGPPTSGGYKQSLGKNRINKDDIIDVEFVEKK